MDYTDEQYDLMDKLRNRVLWNNLSNDEQELVSYLEREGVARPRVDIADGLWMLSPDGERVLDAHRKKVRASQIRESIRQENIRREQEKERNRAEEISREKADRAAEKRADRKFQIALTFLNYFLTFLAGILVQYFTGILDFVIGLFG